MTFTPDDVLCSIISRVVDLRTASCLPAITVVGWSHKSHLMPSHAARPCECQADLPSSSTALLCWHHPSPPPLSPLPLLSLLSPPGGMGEEALTPHPLPRLLAHPAGGAAAVARHASVPPVVVGRRPSAGAGGGPDWPAGAVPRGRLHAQQATGGASGRDGGCCAMMGVGWHRWSRCDRINGLVAAL